MNGWSAVAENWIWLTSGDESADVVGVNLVFYVVVAAGLNNAIVKIPADIAIENWLNRQKSGKTGIIAESGEIGEIGKLAKLARPTLTYQVGHYQPTISTTTGECCLF